MAAADADAAGPTVAHEEPRPVHRARAVRCTDDAADHHRLEERAAEDLPLLNVREPGRLYVVGSNFGQSHHPAWSSNLLADGHATVTIGGKDVPVVATLLTGADRARVWQLFVDLATTYDAYRGRTDRDIRVFALDPG